ncbi:polysaccharide deacetylase family protein [Saccharicrinis sp. GN24d3]|uniref:polysaccharide deacetylase family protein n=1 Tax=Saccharicrinis sp. GN24d3 TaxID=3458416 RepID=UPI004036EC3F
MKKLRQNLKQLFCPLAGILPFKMLRQFANRDLLVINYHSINNADPDPVINKNIYRSVEEFEQDIKFLKKYYRFVSLKEVLEGVAGTRKLGKKCVLLTFDDGLRVVYDKFRPVLIKYDISAAVFINPCFIDNKELHYQRKKNLILHTVTTREVEEKKKHWKTIFAEQEMYSRNFYDNVNSICYKNSSLLNDLSALFKIDIDKYLNRHPIYLSSDQIEKMMEEGFYFGGHSMDHPNYDEISFNEQLRQTLESIEWVSKKYDVNYKVFAFPLRDHNIPVELFEAIKGQCDISFGVRGMGPDTINNHLQRVEVESSSMKIEHALKLEYLKYMLRCLVGNRKYRRKNLVK